MGSRYEDNNRGKQGGQKRRKKGSRAGSFFTTLLLIIAIGVFVFSGLKLLGYYREYKAGTDEYDKLNNQFVTLPSKNTAGSGESGDEDHQEEDGAAGSAAQGETELESETNENGQLVVKKVRRGNVLKNVEELENPQTLPEKIEKAEAVEEEENGTVSMLPRLISPIDFDELQKVNDEIIGWIRIGALDISYPMAQGVDNDYYLHRTFEKTDNFAGCIFLNCDNSKYFTDQNTIVYGHNMKNGSMFGKLKNIKDQEKYDKNPYFWIFTPKFIYQYRIFAGEVVYKQGDPYRVRFTTEEFENFIRNSQERNELDNHGLTVTTDDRITTLSTCTGDDSTRFIVQGVLEQVYVSVKAAK